MEIDIIAIIGPQSSIVAQIVSCIANEFQVPLLSFATTYPTLSSLQLPYFIRTTLSDLYHMNAIAQIVDCYGWREIISIFEDDDYERNDISAFVINLPRGSVEFPISWQFPQDLELIGVTSWIFLLRLPY